MRPTIDNLIEYGTEPLTRWLIEAAKERHAVTYGEAKSRLQREVDFTTIFPIHLGQPAGEAMWRIQDKEPDAPLLNVLLVRQADGMPGSGAGGFMANRFQKRILSKKNIRKDDPQLWRRYFEKAATEVYEYPHWDRLYKMAYGRAYRTDTDTEKNDPKTGGNEKDGQPPNGGGEGKNHRALRLWVRDNPDKILPRIETIRARSEVPLLSGDRVDVAYYARRSTIALEVKSRDSNEADLIRGVYQCVKYRAVLRAMDARRDPDVIAVLVTENELPGHICELAKRHAVRLVTAPKERT